MKCQECHGEIKRVLGFVMEDKEITLQNIYGCPNGCLITKETIDYINETIPKVVFFRLTFPVVATWNGKSTYDNQEIIYVRTIEDEGLKNELLDEKSYSYTFPDGWVANIDAYQVEADKVFIEKEKANKYSIYEHFIDEIIQCGKIVNK